MQLKHFKRAKQDNFLSRNFTKVQITKTKIIFVWFPGRDLRWSCRGVHMYKTHCNHIFWQASISSASNIFPVSRARRSVVAVPARLLLPTPGKPKSSMPAWWDDGRLSCYTKIRRRRFAHWRLFWTGQDTISALRQWRHWHEAGSLIVRAQENGLIWPAVWSDFLRLLLPVVQSFVVQSFGTFCSTETLLSLLRLAAHQSESIPSRAQALWPTCRLVGKVTKR